MSNGAPQLQKAASTLNAFSKLCKGILCIVGSIEAMPCCLNCVAGLALGRTHVVVLQNVQLLRPKWNVKILPRLLKLLSFRGAGLRSLGCRILECGCQASEVLGG